MRTSIDIPDALFARAKRLAAMRGTTLRALAIEGLQAMVDRHRERPVPFRLRDASFGEGGLADGIDETDWERIRDVSYGGRGG